MEPGSACRKRPNTSLPSPLPRFVAAASFASLPCSPLEPAGLSLCSESQCHGALHCRVSAPFGPTSNDIVVAHLPKCLAPGKALVFEVKPRKGFVIEGAEEIKTFNVFIATHLRVSATMTSSESDVSSTTLLRARMTPTASNVSGVRVSFAPLWLDSPFNSTTHTVELHGLTLAGLAVKTERLPATLRVGVTLYWSTEYSMREFERSDSGSFVTSSGSALGWLADMMAGKVSSDDEPYEPKKNRGFNEGHAFFATGHLKELEEFNEDGEQRGYYTALKAYVSSPSPAKLKELKNVLLEQLSMYSNNKEFLSLEAGCLVFSTYEDSDGGIFRSAGFSTSEDEVSACMESCIGSRTYPDSDLGDFY